MPIDKAALTRTVFLLGACAAMPNVANAEALSRPFGDCRAGYWTSTRNLDEERDVGKLTCLVNWKQSVNDNLRFNFAGHAGIADTGDANGSDARMREALVEFDSEAWRVRAGRQIIAWGRADRINPTDALSPRDYTWLVPEDEEQRIGIDAISTRYNVSDALALTAVFVPRFKPHDLPQGTLPLNLRRDDDPEKPEWAFKVDRTGDAWDWSVSYYRGFDRFVRYWTEFSSPTAFVFRGAHEEMQTLGADFATSTGSWSIRGELAASRLALDCMGCPDTSRRVYRAVFGADRELGETANVNLQVFAISRSRYTDPSALPAAQQPLANGLDRLNSEFGEHEAGFTFRIAGRYLNDRLKPEFGAIIDVTNESGLLRPRVSYSLSDAFKLVAGIDHFYGQQQSFFDTRRRNSLSFAEMHWIF